MPTMNRFENPIVFLPGYGEDTRMCEPFRQALERVTERPVIVGDYYDAAVRRRQYTEARHPSRVLADRVMHQLWENNAELGDIVTHSYGAMVADRLYDYMAPESRVALVAPAGIGKVDIGLPTRFVYGMTKEFIKNPQSIAFSIRGATNVLRHPVKSAVEAVELSRANDLNDLRKLGERALVITYANDPVFSDEITARSIISNFDGEVAVVSPLIERANHSSIVEQPEATALIVARHFAA